MKKSLDTICYSVRFVILSNAKNLLPFAWLRFVSRFFTPFRMTDIFNYKVPSHSPVLLTLLLYLQK